MMQRLCFWSISLLAVFGLTFAAMHPLAQVAAASGSPPGNPAQWTRVFGDEFSGNALDTGKWHYCYWGTDGKGCSGGNGEMEWYVPDAITVSGGVMHISANDHPIKDGKGQAHRYTSGLITTTGKFAFQYGYMEARFKTPPGRALWPGFWAVPADHSGPTELDAMEILGQTPNTIYMTIHYANGAGYHVSDGGVWNGPDFSAGFHTIGVDWEPDKLVWYVDGVERKRVTDTQKIPHKPMEMILNLAVGGDWPGAPDATTPFPGDFVVDWVHVWQHGVHITPTPVVAPTAHATTTVPATAGTPPTTTNSSINARLLLWLSGGIIALTLLGVWWTTMRRHSGDAVASSPTEGVE
jgi:beta-glucanase (GH16 family)